MCPQASVRYPNSPRALQVSVIQTWKRGVIPKSISGSSGPKGYLKNDVFFLFERQSRAAEVALVRSSAALLFLWRDQEGRWFDVGDEPVVVTCL